MSQKQLVKPVFREAALPFPWSMPTWSMPKRASRDAKATDREPIADIELADIELRDREMQAWLHAFVGEESGCVSPPPMH